MAGSLENLRANPRKMLSVFLSEWSKKDRPGFIQALINNGNDAIEVLKYMMKKDPAKYLAEESQSSAPPPTALSLAAGPAQPDFSALTGYYLCVILDREEKTLSFLDNGIGMTEKELNWFIGVLGNSVSLYLSPETGVKLLGVDGIGFYRSFVVAKKVVVTTKHPGDNQYVLEFSGTEEKIVFDTYTITEDKVGPPLGRGTKVVVHFTDGDSKWFLSPNILKGYLIAGSKRAAYPVYEWVQNGERGHWEILNPHPKVKQLFDVVMNEEHAGGVGWLTDGKGLYLTADFYSKHMAKDSDMESYLRQLNRLGFQYNKMGNDRYEITHKQGLFDKADLQKVLSISNMYKKKARSKKEQDKQGSTEEKEEEQEKPGSSEEKEEEQEKREEEQEKPGSSEEKEEEQE